MKLLQTISSPVWNAVRNIREVLDCGSPLPLSRGQTFDGIAAEGCRSPRRWRAIHSQLIATVILSLPAFILTAATFTDDFSTHPATNGWQIFGNPKQFAWDGTNQNLRVTWDSAQTNSYFHRPLGTILTRDDDFSLQFDLRLDDYTIGTTPGKAGTFELAIGFLNREQATQTNFYRGAGINATYGPRNLVEFNFFPAFDVFLPTIGQVIVSTNNGWLYDNKLLDLAPGELFQVSLTYATALHTLTTVVSNNTAPYGEPQVIVVPADFDFRVDTISISSYSDAIQPPPPGSILAHGTVDNFRVTVPELPVQHLVGSFENGNWLAQFISRTNWLYTLERTTNFTAWDPVTAAMPGNGSTLALIETNPPAGTSFYRVRANRP